MKNKVSLLAVSALFALISTGCGPTNEPSQQPEEQEQPGEQAHTHSFSEWSVKTPATYEAAGEEHRTCECGEEETRPLAKLEHEFAQNWSSNESKHWKACTDEGYETLKKDEADHTFGQVVVTKAATCTEDGEGTKECTVCHKVVDVTIPKTGHSGVTKHEAVSPTCTKDGNVEYYTCGNETSVYYADEECTTKLDSIVVSATGHGTITKVEAKAATCTEDGNVEYYTCSNEEGVYYADEACTNKLDSVVVSATGHGTITKVEAKEATFDEAGNVEYYTCSNEEGVYYADEACTTKLNSVDFPAKTHTYSNTWSSDETNHWKACTDVGFEQLTTTPEAHSDSNNDFYCDVCDKELPGVKRITLEYLTGYIGAGESVLLTANVEAYGGVSEEVEWHLEKSNGSNWTKTNYLQYGVEDFFTLTDNLDGTATLSGVQKEYINEFSCFVYATSKYDSSVSSNMTEKILYQTWNNTKRGTLNTFFGADQWQTIPFFPSCTLTLSENDTVLTGYNTYKRSLKQMVASFDNQGVWTKEYVTSYEAKYTLTKDGYVYTCILDEEYYKSGTYYPEFVITKAECLTEWPTEKVAGLVSGLYATGTVPAFESGSLYETHQAADSLDYSKVTITVDDADTALSSYISTLEGADWFLYRTDGSWNYYGYEGKTLLICPYISSDKLVIEFDVNDCPVSKPLTSWPTDTVATALTLAEETAVAATGTSFEIMSQSTNTIKIKVYGDGDLYTQALVSANYTKDTSSPYYHPVYTSSTGTIVVTVDLDSYDYFVITLVSKLPDGVSTSFPLDEVKEIIGATDAVNIVSATGTKFTLTKNDDYDVTIKVEGGDKSAFETDLGTAQFVSAMAGSYSKENLCCDVATVDGGYTINYYLAEKPETTGPVWPASDFSSMFPVNGSKLTQPTTGTLVSVTVTENPIKVVIVMQGITAKDFKNHLSSCGFYASADNTSGYGWDEGDVTEMYFEWTYAAATQTLTVEVTPY